MTNITSLRIVPTWSDTDPFDLSDIKTWPPQMFPAYCRARSAMIVSGGMNYEAIKIPDDGGFTSSVINHMRVHGPFDTKTGVAIAGTYVENALRDAPLDIARLILYYDRVLARNLAGAPDISHRIEYAVKIFGMKNDPNVLLEGFQRREDLTMVTRRALGLQTTPSPRKGALF